jgi:predicted type IV restriction endonuclease
MAYREFVKLVKRLSQQVVDAPDTLKRNQRNEEWTKVNFILKLLDGLGWDSFNDMDYEVSSEDDEGALDFTFRCQPPIGIEAKALDVKPPEDRSHPQITKGLQQAQDRRASYFIWTNGDCWQFYSLALPDAPIHSLTLSKAHGNHEKIERIASEFQFLQKGSFTTNPKLFDKAILEKWKTAALPAALDVLLNERTHDLLQLLRRDLPSELDIKDDEILTFLKDLSAPRDSAGPAKKRGGKDRKPLSFPEDWQKLLDSFEPKYEKARKRFRKDYYRKLAQYIIGDQYSQWSKETTWRHVGTPKDPDERKKLGPVIALFREWHFIEVAEGVERYQRVEESVTYLRKLLEEPMNP